jgi:hypothetical protein
MSFPTVIYSSQRHVRSGESTAGFVLWLHVMLLHLPGNPLLLSLLWVCVLSALHLLVLLACKVNELSSRRPSDSEADALPALSNGLISSLQLNIALSHDCRAGQRCEIGWDCWEAVVDSTDAGSAATP